MNTLQQLRKKIDQIDGQIIDLLIQRCDIVLDIGAYKRLHNIPYLDRVRWSEVLQSNIIQGKKKWLSEKFVTDLRERIHYESLKIQQSKNSA